MPSEEENIQYLYLVLTYGGAPTVDWDPVCAAMQLEKGAATKRWSRLKQAMEKGERPASWNYEFLWLLIKHSTREKAYDWEGIASQCNSTKGACSKRYSRLKLAFERGDAPPSTPGKTAPSTPKKTSHKCKAKVDDEGDGTPTTTPKRKRTPAKKIADNNNKFKPDGESDDEEDTRLKRAKSISKLKSKPKPKNAFRASDQNNEAEKATIIVENAVVDDDDDVFLDAPEQTAADVTATDEEDQKLQSGRSSPSRIGGTLDIFGKTD